MFYDSIYHDKIDNMISKKVVSQSVLTTHSTFFLYVNILTLRMKWIIISYIKNSKYAMFPYYYNNIICN